MIEIEDTMHELRRASYVDALMQMKDNDNVIGIFGENIDEAFLYGYGLVVVPIVGVDSHIFEYGSYDACDTVKSTIIYLKTGKCPLLYSSKMYVLSNICDKMHRAFLDNTKKKVELYSSNEILAKTIKNVYGLSFDNKLYQDVKEKMDYIYGLYKKIEKSNLSMKDKFLLTFYSKYILSLDKRIDFLDSIVKNLKIDTNNQNKVIFTPCPYGIYHNVSELFDSSIILKQGIENIDIACNGCIYDAPLYINY